MHINVAHCLLSLVFVAVAVIAFAAAVVAAAATTAAVVTIVATTFGRTHTQPASSIDCGYLV